MGMPSGLGGMGVGPSVGGGSALSAGFNGVDETGFGDVLNMGGAGAALGGGASLGGGVSLSKCKLRVK